MFHYNYLFYNLNTLRNDPIGINFLPFSFFNQTKKQNKYFFFFITSNIFFKNSLIKFFVQSSFQTEQEFLKIESTNSFLLKNDNNTYMQSNAFYQSTKTNHDLIFASKINILKLKLILENYKIVVTIIHLNLFF